jgi:phosphoribosylaminoimidazole-succinocarboxamide synthase
MVNKKEIYSGKAKTIYDGAEPRTFIVKFRDDLTAFNGEKKSTADNKGYYNAQISARLFERLACQGIKTHYLNMISDTEMLVKAVDIIKIEVIVRNIAAGSITKRYPISEGTILNPPIISLDFKSDEYGDPMLNEDIACAMKLATREEIEIIKALALKINTHLVFYAGTKGLLVPDFKLEFGKFDNEILLADEISCDTCRFWDMKTRKSLDKDVFRFDKGDVSQVYEEVARRLVPDIFPN